MKNLFLLFCACIVLISCTKDKINNSNPNLPNYTFSVTVDTSLPSYSVLGFAGNGVTVTQNGAGIRGVFVFNTGSGYTAWDMACPNQSLGACSTMTLNGINGVCPCDGKEYSLYTGLSSGMKYPLKQYRIEDNGGVLRVYN